jgi:hypothetical protein
MIAENMIVSWDGRLAKDITNGDLIDALLETDPEITQEPALVLGAPVFHMCQRVTTPSGCEAICSNNALVIVDDPHRPGRAVVNCQSIGLYRVAVIIDGLLQYEPAIAVPYLQVPVCQLLVPGGAISAGASPNRRILFTIPR